MDIQSTERKFNGHLKVDEITLKNSNNKTVIREVVTKHSAVASIVFNTETEKYIFVSQWRPGPKDFIIELVAGLLDVEDENPSDAMKREILEETGYKTDRINTLVDRHYSSPGFTDETITIYYAEVSEKMTDKLGVGDEEITLVEFDYTSLTHGLMDFKDAKTILALYKMIINKKNR